MRASRFTMIASAALLAAFSVPGVSEEARVCCAAAVGALQAPSTIKVRLGADDALTKPFGVLIFSLPLRDLGALREALEHGPLEVVVVDRADRQVVGGGTLTSIDNIVDQTAATVRLKAVFPRTNG